MDRGVAHWIFEAAANTPGKVAAIHNDETVTYRNFAQRIALTRGYFTARGVVGEGTAIVAIHHLLDLWVVSVALRSLGVTTMPVRDAAVAADAGLPDLRCVVKSPGEAWPGLQELCEERGWPLIEPVARGEPLLYLDPHDVTVQPGGHILQTSGTTGLYKKVLIDPSFEEPHLRERQRLRNISARTVDCVFHYQTWTSIGYRSPVAAWMLGGGALFWQGRKPHLALRNPNITHTAMTPPMLAEILAEPAGSFPRSETMQVVLAGGTVTWAQIEEAKARISPRLSNHLLATESAFIGATPLNTPEDHRWHCPSPGHGVEIVDEFDEPTPVGQVGRVRVSTADAPTGYLHDEETTRAFFRNGFFYPGDLAILREDGRFALQGRVSDVLNVQGVKISPAPTEDELREALAVSGACLFTMQDDSGVERLHLIIESAVRLPVDRLNGVLGPLCARWGFANAFVHYLAAFPRNPNGKMLRSAAREAALAQHRVGISLSADIAPARHTLAEG